MRKNIKILHPAFMVFFLFLTAISCSPLIKMHQEAGPMNIAVLKIHDNQEVGVDFIDGKEVQSFPSKWLFEVLPGQHVVQVSHKDWSDKDSPHDPPRPLLVKVNALPRHLYFIEYHLGTHYAGAEIDDVTDEAVQAVKTGKYLKKWDWALEYIKQWGLK